VGGFNLGRFVDPRIHGHSQTAQANIRLPVARRDFFTTRSSLTAWSTWTAAGIWVGHCLLRQALRTFRLDRVSQPEIGSERFEPAGGFDIKAYLNQGMPFVQSAFAIDVWVDLPASETRSHFPLHRIAMLEENGGTTLQCGRDNLEPFAAMLLSLGCRIVVRAPPELKEAFSKLAHRASVAAEV